MEQGTESAGRARAKAQIERLIEELKKLHREQIKAFTDYLALSALIETSTDDKTADSQYVKRAFAEILRKIKKYAHQYGKTAQLAEQIGLKGIDLPTQ